MDMAMADPNLNTTPPTDTVPIAPPNPYYEIRALPGKGYGCVAITTIPRGTRILSDAPLLSVSNGHYMATDITSAFALLAPEQKAQYMSLHSAHGQPASWWPSRIHPSVPIHERHRIEEQHQARTAASASLLSIFQTNCMEQGVGAAVFPHAARFNHSCRPNATFNWNAATGRETVHAMREIGVGEEVTLCYVDGDLERTRRGWEVKHYGFVCACEACGEEEDGEDESSPAFKSEQRRLQLQDLDRETRLLRGLRLGEGAKQPSFVSKLLKMAALLQEEGVWDARLAGIFLDIALVCEVNGDFQMGVKAGEKAVLVKKDAQGSDFPDWKKYAEVLERIRASWRRGVGDSKGWMA